jgi:hypothetical protein
MFLKPIGSSDDIIHIIHRYNNYYVKLGTLPAILCPHENGTHIPLVARMDSDNAYLYCLTCGYEKLAGWATADTLLTAMRSQDLINNS